MDLVNSLSNSMNEKCGIIKKRELDVLDDSLAKWSPMASEINRDEFLGISFSHHMEILHKTKNIEEVLFCIHEAVVHQWDKYTLRDILKAGIPQPDHTAPNNFLQTMSSPRQAMKAIRMSRMNICSILSMWKTSMHRKRMWTNGW